MKKKIFVLSLLGVLATMFTSCLVVFPGEYDYEYESGCSGSTSSQYTNYGKLIVTNNIREGYVSEISYGTNDGCNSKWYWAWNDGHDYDYRSISADYYWGTSSGNIYTCKIPVGYKDIRVTVVYPEYNGTYTYEDFIFEDQYISKYQNLYLTVNHNNVCPR